MKPYYVTITQKPSGTGTIHDIASDQYDRHIRLRSNHNYIVITPAYYNMFATRHVKPASAARQASKLYKQGYQGVTILDRYGDEVFLNYD